jgi:hypothetical protein
MEGYIFRESQGRGSRDAVVSTKQELFAHGMSLGLTNEQVVSLLRKGGFDGSFDEGLYDKYIEYLDGWNSRYQELVKKYDDEPKPVPRETIAQKAERVMRRVGEREWYFPPIAYNISTGEYRACIDGLEENEELIYEGVLVKDFLSIRS